jgi:hypothetical protein
MLPIPAYPMHPFKLAHTAHDDGVVPCNGGNGARVQRGARGEGPKDAIRLCPQAAGLPVAPSFAHIQDVVQYHPRVPGSDKVSNLPPMV